MTKKRPEKPENIEERNPDKLGTEGVSHNFREGIDFYIEDGLYVFTEKYLRQRGYCCESGCRHCPYNFKKEKTA